MIFRTLEVTMDYIKNKEDIVSHGNRLLRNDAIEILEHGLLKADPYVATKNLVTLKNNILAVGEVKLDLNDYGDIYIVGAGKATYPIAKALEEILKDRIKDGVITCKHGQEGKLQYCRLYFGAHPAPDEDGYRATCEMMNLAHQVKAKDIVFSAMTGGMTSLMPYPAKNITVQELHDTYMTLLRSGANIIEMNMVRKHLTRSKAGFLAMAMNPEAIIFNLTVSDVIGSPLDYLTDPTVPDTSSFDDARQVMDKYKLWDKVAFSVADYLKNGSEANETPKTLPQKIYTSIIVYDNIACAGAMEYAKKLGYHSIILSNMFEGESAELASFFAAIAKEVAEYGMPLNKPCVFIAGGEATVKVTIPNPGTGGPSQTFALAAAKCIKDYKNIVIAGIDTDGTDGPTDEAGGIVDYSTVERAAEMDINIDDYLARFDPTPALIQLKDVVHTGATGTNVNDLKVMIIR